MMRVRSIGAVTAVATLILVGTACEPAPPRPVFRPAATVEGSDALPGDGVCATPTGECSLEAAFDEANAQPRARIELEAGTYPAVAVTARTDLELFDGDLNRAQVHVAEGAVLRARGIGVGAVTVDGVLIVDRSGFGFDEVLPSPPPNLHVGPSGVVVGSKVTFLTWVQGGVRNEGRLSLRYATFLSGTVAPDRTEAVLSTVGSGTTTLGATAFLGSSTDEMLDACAGTPPSSEGWNLTYDATCDLTQPSDVEGVAEPSIDPEPGSPRIDAIPLGTLGCVEGPTSTFGLVQGFNGDEDGTVACDIGIEVDAP